jgi:hypothetical protein
MVSSRALQNFLVRSQADLFSLGLCGGIVARMKTLSTALLVVVGMSACGHDDVVPPAGSACANRQVLSLPDCESGTDRFSDEACIPFDDALTQGRATADAMRSPSVMAPTEAQSVSGAVPFVFTWTAPMARVPARRPMTVGDELWRWTSLVSTAEAHCSPFTGRAYELRLKVGQRVVMRRQQSALSWAPTMTEWTALKTAAGSNPIDLTVYTVVYTSNLLASGTGPFYASTPRRFTIAN